MPSRRDTPLTPLPPSSSAGPSVLEIINSLLSHLRQSVTTDRSAGSHKGQNDERHYQEALINALGEFANNLPGGWGGGKERGREGAREVL